jgi:DNA-binding transcriptional LysR family regulator
MDKLQAITVFLRVVEAGSFSAVALETSTTQSAVSKQVAALERALGTRLLTRTTRSLALTEEGERYFERVRRLVAEMNEAEGELRRGEQQLVGWLRIAASVGFGRIRLMPMIQTFLAAHPQVKIDVRLQDSVIDLVEEGIDAAVRIGDMPDSTLIARQVGTSPRHIVAHSRYLASLGNGLTTPVKPEDLAAHNCIVYTESPMRNNWTFTAGKAALEPEGTTRVVRVTGNLQSNSSEVIRTSVLAGMGIGCSPAWLFHDEIASGEVQLLLANWQLPPVSIHFVSPRERRDSAKVKAFARHIADSLAEG